MERDAVVDFGKYVDQRIRVKFQGGREVEGVLKGFDKLDNLGNLGPVSPAMLHSIYSA